MSKSVAVVVIIIIIIIIPVILISHTVFNLQAFVRLNVGD